ncbi:DUF551 domain-containing protein [Enterobacter cloacae complex sp. IR5428]|uniref:DUF551 domain-containing protein n=1 Tax=Enterobacter cloacae complex sp. IR5428 TaxID=3412365 RepID=UPI003BA77FCD
MTLTKEWLQQTIAELEEERDAVPGAVNEDAAMALAAMKLALASLEAEAVGEVVLGEYDDCGCHPNARVACIAADGQADWENFKDGTRLYTAPPAPVVPDEATPDNIQILASTYAPRGVTYQWDSDECNAAADSWNACRTAMLQGAEPVSNRDELTDGWVACSERMPEDEQEVLTRNRMGHCFVSFFDEHSGLFFDRIDVAAACCIEHILVTHWMPLPAAPKQEVIQALAKGMESYGDAMKELAKREVKHGR